jgi:hypothetical protein
VTLVAGGNGVAGQVEMFASLDDLTPLRETIGTRPFVGGNRCSDVFGGSGAMSCVADGGAGGAFNGRDA